MTTLQDIHWFTFVQKPSELNTLTIWQAIAYIMQNQEGLEEELEKYKKDINAIELIEAADYLESHFDINNPAMIVLDGRQQALRKLMNETMELGKWCGIESFSEKDLADLIIDDENHTLNPYLPDEHCDTIKDGMLQHLEIQDNLIDQCLSELNNYRHDLLQDHPIADLLYKVLANEIDGILSKKKSDLKLAENLNFNDKSNGYFDHAILIKKSSLKNWKTISTIKNLGLLDSSINAQPRKARADLIENHLKVIGMLMNELWETDPDSVKSNTQTSRKFTICKLTKSLLDRVKTDDSEFMQRSKLNKILADAKKTVEENIKLKNDNSPFLP